jgi:hypothetical protein
LAEILDTLLPKEETFLFSVTDQPMLCALDLYREEPSTGIEGQYPIALMTAK